MALLRIEPPASDQPAGPSWNAFLSYAFRPFYLLAALQGVLSVLAWSLGFGGTDALPGFLWHGHEMVWGYAGAIIVGFLLTAVATWTGQLPVRGAPLALLAVLWLAARVLLLAVPGAVWPGALCSAGFFVLAAALFAAPIVRTGNRRNLLPVALLVSFGAADALFLAGVSGAVAVDPRRVLHTGLLLVAVVIFLMGLRVIPFFTARRLQVEQVPNPVPLLVAGIALPLLAAVGVGAGVATWLPAGLLVAGGTANLISLTRWWDRGVAGEPMLWVLFAGFGCTAAGAWLYGLTLALAPHALSAPVHLVAVGGIGTLTVGMMTRTALGHTGRAIAAPRGLTVAFALMGAAGVLRVLSVYWSAAHALLMPAAGLCFAAALALFAWRFAPWLVRPRADGRP